MASREISIATTSVRSLRRIGKKSLCVQTFSHKEERINIVRRLTKSCVFRVNLNSCFCCWGFEVSCVVLLWCLLLEFLKVIAMVSCSGCNFILYRINCSKIFYKGYGYSECNIICYLSIIFI